MRLGERYGNGALEAACTRALQFDEPAYATVKRILVTGVAETAPSVTATPQAPGNSPPPSPAYTYARTAVELLGHLFGGVPWS